jgi:hypothetical protein
MCSDNCAGGRGVDLSSFSQAFASEVSTVFQDRH